MSGQDKYFETLKEIKEMTERLVEEIEKEQTENAYKELIKEVKENFDDADYVPPFVNFKRTHDGPYFLVTYRYGSDLSSTAYNIETKVLTKGEINSLFGVVILSIVQIEKEYTPAYPDYWVL